MKTTIIITILSLLLSGAIYSQEIGSIQSPLKRSKLSLIKKKLTASQRGLMGADSSGGGSFVLNNNTPVLLDYMMFNENFIDSFDLSEESHITVRPHAYVLGYQKIKFDYFKKMPIYNLLEKQLNLWKTSSPILTHVINKSLKAIDWRLTPHRIMSFYENQNIVGGVFYSKDLGAWLSVPTWNTTGDLSKAGLLLHEAFRHLSIVYEGDMSEEDIHYLTSKIMLTSPHKNETLDNSKYFKGALVKDIFLRKEVREKYTLKIENVMLESLDSDLIKKSPKMTQIINKFLEDISFDTVSTFIISMNNMYQLLDDDEAIEINRTLANKADDYMRKEGDFLLSQGPLNVGRNLNNMSNNISRVIGENLIAKYIDTNENPFEWHELSAKNKLSYAISLLKKYQKRLLDSKVLVTPY